MPFIPHTTAEIEQMLTTIGVQQLDDLFIEIPDELKLSNAVADPIQAVPSGLTELEIKKLLSARAEQDSYKLNFIGAGSYEHHIPAAIWDIASRGEFLTSYTPYQAEASQGTLQLLYEYQTMLTRLMATQVSNASMYDGATALAEAVLMAVRLSGGKRSKILLPQTVHPNYRLVVQTVVQTRDIELIAVPYAEDSGRIAVKQLIAGEIVAAQNLTEVAALVIPQPNFFGVIEEVDNLVTWAHAQGILVIAVVNPLAMALLRPPGEWGQQAADIICGEGQPFGIPLASGGPYCGFMCCKKAYVRQLPGRIVGRTTDANGKIGYVLTLQAREQHIRRAKATSNICTNQGLLVTAMTLYMSMLGFAGIRAVALKSHHNTLTLAKLLQEQGFKPKFNAPYFHEVILQAPASASVQAISAKLAQERILSGYVVEGDYPELANCIICCATETKTAEELAMFAQAVGRMLTKTSSSLGSIA